MQIDSFQHIGEILFFSSFVGDSLAFVLITASILVMHFLLPNAVLDKFFKPPYFKETECAFLTGIPYAPLRTIMFMRAIAYPGSGKKRGIKDAHLLVPNWYRVTSKIIVISIIVIGLIIVLQLLGFWLLFFLNKSSTP